MACVRVRLTAFRLQINLLTLSAESLGKNRDITTLVSDLGRPL